MFSGRSYEQVPKSTYYNDLLLNCSYGNFSSLMDNCLTPLQKIQFVLFKTQTSLKFPKPSQPSSVFSHWEVEANFFHLFDVSVVGKFILTKEEVAKDFHFDLSRMIVS